MEKYAVMVATQPLVVLSMHLSQRDLSKSDNETRSIALGTASAAAGSGGDLSAAATRDDVMDSEDEIDLMKMPPAL